MHGLYIHGNIHAFELRKGSILDSLTIDDFRRRLGDSKVIDAYSVLRRS